MSYYTYTGPLQIKTYSEYGGESHIMTWDQSQRGSVTIDHRYNDESDSENTLKLFWWSLSNQNFFRLGLAEYVVLSVTLALVIIRFFPAVHKQIVSRITTAERKSIYWGTFAVCNLFSGRFLAMRFSVIKTLLYPKYVVSTVFGVEISIHMLIIFGGLISSYKNRCGNDVPLPKPVKCICLRKPKYVTISAFMLFIYHLIMDTISISFLLLTEQSRSCIIFLAFLFILIMIYVFLVVSSIFFYKYTYLLSYRKYCINSWGVCCILTLMFAALILVIVMYMFVLFPLNLQVKGLIGIIAGLIALSSASWYIKNKLLARTLNPPNAHAGNGGNARGGEADDDQRMLLP